jgi:hypothetical protein
MEGGRGAPLSNDELPHIERSLAYARAFLSPVHRSHIDRHGFFEGTPGDYTTACIDNKACVFVYYEEEIAKCSLERVYYDNKNDWKKPISCHLFPIRVSNGRRKFIRYEKIPECNAGIVKGTKEDTSLIEFLKEPLRRRFSEEWYEDIISQLNGKQK